MSLWLSLPPSLDPEAVFAEAIDASATPVVLATIARAGYLEEPPAWYMVDVAFVERFAAVVPLDTLKTTKGLEKMMVIRKGSRLSIQPVTPAELAERLAKAARSDPEMEVQLRADQAVPASRLA